MLIRLFEWEDQPWLPRRLRGYLTELLRHQVGEVYLPALPILTRWLAANECRHVVDLCSGAGGPWPVLAAAMQESAPTVLFTDIHPYDGPVPADRGGYHPVPVDARSIPAELVGCRTIFTGLHHFGRAEARELLRRAADERVPIAVFEFTEARWRNVLGMLLSPIVVWAQTPAIKPFRWGRLVWTYVLPVVPALYLWDGIVSHLRSYRVADLESLATGLDRDGYGWEAGRVIVPSGGAPITYLLGGRPAASAGDG